APGTRCGHGRSWPPRWRRTPTQHASRVRCACSARPPMLRRTPGSTPPARSPTHAQTRRCGRFAVMYPPGYHLTLLRGDDGTPFADPAEQERVWGRRWGAHDEVGRLRSVLVRRPRREFAVVRAECWSEDAGALVDPDGLWYWESRDPPDLDL